MQVSHQEARRPDQMTAQLKKGFEWTASHSKAVVTIVGLALVVGAAFAIWGWAQSQKEATLQEKFYQFERLYLDKKEKFDQYEATSNRPVDPKTKVAPKPEGEKRTGDLTQDFGPSVQGFTDLLKESPKSRAGALAALSLAQLYNAYQKPTEAIAALQQAQNAPGTLGALVRMELGTTTANHGDCKAAIDIWSALLKDRNSTFLAPQVKLKMGLCSESLGQTAQAEDFYKQVLSESKESAAGRSAERYLRILQSGTAQTL